MTLRNARKQLHTALKIYNKGNPGGALRYAQLAAELFEQAKQRKTFSTQDNYDYLNAVTLLQSIFSTLHDAKAYLSWEPQVKALIQLLFPYNFAGFYSLHLLDVFECLLISGYPGEALNYKEQAFALLEPLEGQSNYVLFLNAYNNAKYAFYTDDYYSCVDNCQLANDLWYDSNGTQVFPSFLEDTSHNHDAIDNIGFQNLLLLCNAYGKIYNTAEAIYILEELLQHGGLDYYKIYCAELTLASLYMQTNQHQRAKYYFDKYRFQPPITMPDIETIRYNYGLHLVNSGKYQDALKLFSNIGKKGYYMTLALLEKLKHPKEIAPLYRPAMEYMYQQIQQIFMHYEEQLAYNHIAHLQYHIDLCLGAFLYCYHSGKNLISLEDIYDFTLNTKYISLEASYLLQHKKALSDRALFSTKQLQTFLPEHTQLLEYTLFRTLHGTYYGVFILSAKELHYLSLCPEEELNELLLSWRETMLESARITGDAARQAQRKLQTINTKLRHLLYLPIKSYLQEGCQLRIAPAGALADFPFSCLTTSATGLLVDSHAITYLNSGKELLTAQNLSPATKNQGTFAEQLAANPLLIGNPLCSFMPSLPYAEAEVDYLAEKLNYAPYKNSSATLELFHFENAPSLLHIAAHGTNFTFSEDSHNNWESLYSFLTQSGILLSDDALLSCAEISTLDFSGTALATLSCCYSGKGVYLNTEGIFGLRRAFTLAGCPILLVSLWQVDDAASLLFTRTFYEAILDLQLEVTDAFHHAVRFLKTYKENGVFPYKHPYFWAGYVLIYTKA